EYDALLGEVNINPNVTPYLSKRSIGLSTITNKDTWMYSLKPVNPKAKILIIAGTHAGEKAYIHVLRSLIRDLSINWETNRLLEFLRWNIQIDIIPVRMV